MKLPGATTRVLSSLLLGAVVGLALARWHPDAAATAAAIAQPIGRLWLSALQMTVVPLVLALVILGVASAADAATSGRVARRAMVLFVAMLSLFAAYAAIVAPALLSLVPRSEQLAATLAGTAATATSSGAPSLAEWVSGVIPSNAIMAAAQGAMLPLVVFALFFGFALTRLDEAPRAQVVGFFKAIADAMIVIVHWVLWVAPLGIFALVLALTARAGLGMLQALGIYILLECALYVLAVLLLIVVAVTIGKRRFRHFMAGLVPVQAVAASTQSSLATLPAMLDSAQNRLGIPARVSGLVLPMAVSLFRITSPIQYIATACFIAWALGVDLSATQLATGVALSVLVSMGSVGLPGQAIFLATNLPVTSAMGLPIAPLPVLMAVDAIPDVLATVGNVTADMTATTVVHARSEHRGATVPPATTP